MSIPASMQAVEREIRIDAGPETIWALLTDADRAVRWMGSAALFDPRPGGIYRLEVVPGSTVLGRFLELDPPRRLVFSWGWESGPAAGVPPGSTTVEIDLIPGGGGTTLRLRHSGLDGPGAIDRHADGWDHYLPRLAIASAGVDPGRDSWARGSRR